MTIDAFLATLTAPLDSGWGHVVSTRAPGGQLHRALDHLTEPDLIDQTADEIAALAEHGDVYIGAAAMTRAAFTDVRASGPGKRGGARHIGAITALWADIDIAGVGHAADRLPASVADVDRVLGRLPEPTMIIHTGGGLHVWWCLTTPHPTAGDQHRGITDRWVRGVAGHAHDTGGWLIDAAVGDLPRVLRPPGTANHKTAPPRPVQLVHHSPVRYGLDALAAVADEAPPLPTPAPPPRPPTPATSRHTGSGGGGAGVLRAVDALDWARIWPPSWEYVGHETIDGHTVELWRRPGAASPHSAKCWPAGGCHVWSDQIPGLPAGPHSKAEIYAWRFGCSISELAAELAREARRHTQPNGRRR